MKKRLWQITAYRTRKLVGVITIFTFIVIYLVGFHGINTTKANDNIQRLENCLNENSSDKKLGANSPCNNSHQQQKKQSISINSNSLSNFIAQKRFFRAISKNLPIIPQPNSFEYILLRSYGAAHVNSQPGIKLPEKVIFGNEQETKEFQATLTMGKVNGTRNCYLQKPAADALNKARSQIRIPLMSSNGNINCTRSFAKTVKLWRKYANNQTLDNVRQGKETRILGVVAPPGTSQHLWGLAVDLRVRNQAQIKALNQNAWYRTVKNDTPHWTYIGYSPEQLEDLGFKDKVIKGIRYWLTPL